MDKDVFIVVSDRFINYHELDHCITYSNIIEHIETSDKSGVLIIGQGISEEQVAFLTKKIQENNSSYIISNSRHISK